MKHLQPERVTNDRKKTVSQSNTSLFGLSFPNPVECCVAGLNVQLAPSSKVGIPSSQANDLKNRLLHWGRSPSSKKSAGIRPSCTRQNIHDECVACAMLPRGFKIHVSRHMAHASDTVRGRIISPVDHLGFVGLFRFQVQHRLQSLITRGTRVILNIHQFLKYQTTARHEVLVKEICLIADRLDRALRF